MRPRLLALLALGVASLVGHPARSATTWSVEGASASCSDAGPGDALRPFCTIGRGAAGAVAGGTVLVAPATYREQVTAPTSGVSGAPITFRASGPGVIVLGTLDVSDPAAWTPTATNAWRRSFAPASNPSQVFRDGTRLSAAASAGTTIPDSFFYDGAARVLYVDIGGGNPGAGHVIEAGARQYGFRLDKADYFNNPEFKDYPVIYDTWGQAKIYCEWTGRRLPTEAEWERAARGDDMRTFPWGEDKADYRFANFNMLVTDTSRVGSYPLGASPFGVLDMAGNVAEWTNDIYSPTFYASALEMFNPVGPTSSSSLRRVVRGGSLGDAEINIRVSKRSSVSGSDLRAQRGSPEYLGDFSPRIGFRCAMDK